MTHFQDDMDDGDVLGQLFNSSQAPLAPKAPRADKPAWVEDNVVPVHEEICQKCRGSGRYGSFGQCFACKGRGKKVFKSSFDQRQKARVSRENKKARTAQENLEAFKVDHPALWSWMDGSTFPFAVSLREAVAKYGSLTENQQAAAYRCVAKFEAAKEASAAAKAARAQALASAPPADTSKLQAAFDRARESARQDGEGIMWLKLRLDTFVFSDAPANGQWAAAIFVKEGTQKLGRISQGRFIRSRECTDDQEKRILAAAADPQAAAIAYGQRWNSCSVCGRTLTNAISRARNIGPICAERFGW